MTQGRQRGPAQPPPPRAKVIVAIATNSGFRCSSDQGPRQTLAAAADCAQSAILLCSHSCCRRRVAATIAAIGAGDCITLGNWRAAAAAAASDSRWRGAAAFPYGHVSIPTAMLPTRETRSAFSLIPFFFSPKSTHPLNQRKGLATKPRLLCRVQKRVAPPGVLNVSTSGNEAPSNAIHSGFHTTGWWHARGGKSAELAESRARAPIRFCNVAKWHDN